MFINRQIYTTIMQNNSISKKVAEHEERLNEIERRIAAEYAEIRAIMRENAE